MTTREQKFTQGHELDQRIDHDPNENVNQHSTLLRVKEEQLATIQNKIETESRVFWLQTFAMFIFIYASTCSKENTGVDLAFFVGIFMAIPIIARQTGANLNPAVSLSMITKNGSSSTYSLMWLYFKAQILGAIISMIFALTLNGVQRSPLHPLSSSAAEIIRMILSQVIGVFVLIFFVLYVTGPLSFIENNGAKFFYISLFVYIGRKFAAYSGNQINLALTISQAFVGIPLCDYSGFKYIWIWALGDLLGVLLASCFYNNLIEPTASFLKRRQIARQNYRKAQQSTIELKDIASKH